MAAENHNNDVKPTILHDFLGRRCSPVTNFATATAVSGASPPSASVSAAAGPISTASDLGSERHAGTLLEGVPLFNQKPDFAGSRIRYSGGKRSNSDSDFPENSHLMKMLRTVGAERPRWSREGEPFMAQPVNVGPVMHYPPPAGQAVPYSYQPVSNRFKDSNSGPPLISHSAADEGSRTGIKGSGLLSSVNVSGAVAEPLLKTLTTKPEPGGASTSRQMTIFYGGQAHVFDDVHPNKADVIMTLAGSNGGSWSTTFLPKPSAVKRASGSGAEEKSEEKL